MEGKKRCGRKEIGKKVQEGDTRDFFMDDGREKSSRRRQRRNVVGEGDKGRYRTEEKTRGSGEREGWRRCRKRGRKEGREKRAGVNGTLGEKVRLRGGDTDKTRHSASPTPGGKGRGRKWN